MVDDALLEERVTLLLWFFTFLLELAVFFRGIYTNYIDLQKEGNTKIKRVTELVQYATYIAAFCFILSTLGGFSEALLWFAGKRTTKSWCQAQWYFAPTANLMGKNGSYFIYLTCLYLANTVETQKILRFKMWHIYGYAIWCMGLSIIFSVLIGLTHEIDTRRSCNGKFPDWIAILFVMFDIFNTFILIFNYVWPISAHISQISNPNRQDVVVVRRMLIYTTVNCASTLVFFGIIAFKNSVGYQGLDAIIHVGVLFMNLENFSKFHKIIIEYKTLPPDQDQGSNTTENKLQQEIELNN